jgi:hypothetical protein
MSASEPVVSRIVALFAALDREEVAAMPKLQRDTFTDLCRHWADVAGRQQQGQARGVLGELQGGRRHE